MSDDENVKEEDAQNPDDLNEHQSLDTVKVPKEFEPIFQKAQEYVSKYFQEKREEPSKGTIEIFGERYILVRSASMSVDFFETIQNLYQDEGGQEALNVARNLLFDIAHAIGRTDAKNFHKKMKLEDPIEKLSAGPIHFSHSGWAFVDIFQESRPSPDENYYLIYDHPFSFESDAWLKAGKKTDFPVCVMNAGYSSGWCEESFGITLVASEIMCKAKGDEACRFIMAPPSKIEGYIKEYLEKEPELAKKITEYDIPGFFKRKQMEKALQEKTDFLDAVLNNVSEGIFVVDRNFNYIFINPASGRILGHTPEEWIGKRAGTNRHPDDAEKTAKAIMKALDGEPASSEIRVKASDGEYRLLDIKYSTMMWEDEVHILGVVDDITEKKKAEEELQASLREKEVLLKEIHHRVKNNLQIISSLLNLQSMHLKDKETQKAFNEMQNRIKSMGIIHDRLYKTGDLTEINFKDYLRDLLNHITQSYLIDPGRITVHLDIDDLSIDVDMAVTCSLMINELVSNSILHAFPDNRSGNINIDLHLADEGKEITVSDDGVGLPEDLDFRRTGSLGLQLVNTLVCEFGGEIVHDNSNGTKFIIKIPTTHRK